MQTDISVQPTDEEKEAAAALNGRYASIFGIHVAAFVLRLRLTRWVRKGTYRFTFEIHDLHKKDLFNVKEAHNHSFSYKVR